MTSFTWPEKAFLHRAVYEFYLGGPVGYLVCCNDPPVSQYHGGSCILGDMGARPCQAKCWC